MNWNSPENKQLVEAVLMLRTPEETRSFLRDLMTEGELVEFAKRLETARLLSAGTPYSVIESRIGFSPTTIARVSKWLQDGEGGYRTIINRLSHTHTPASPGRGLR